MKKQYEATWFNTDGNMHTLWPIYASDEQKAREQAISFMLQRWGKRFVNMDSLFIR